VKLGYAKAEEFFEWIIFVGLNRFNRQKNSCWQGEQSGHGIGEHDHGLTVV